MILNTHPENRKAIVKAICELTGMNATYLFTPTYAYQVGPITVSRDGSIDCVTVSPTEEKALMVAMYDGRLQELWQADLKTGKVKRLSHFNDAALKGKYIAPFRALSVESEGRRLYWQLQ